MKKSLFALTSVLLAGSSAFAMDVTNPFYIPVKGDFLSETSAVYTNLQHGYREKATFAETVSYGITNKLSVNGTLADDWSFDNWQNNGRKRLSGHDKYDNPAWGVGLKYNLVDCCKSNWKTQVGANYDQGGMNHHTKGLSAFIKAGYQLDKVLPYATVEVKKPVGKYEGGPVWRGRVAAYAPLAEKVRLDAGVSYEWDSDTDGRHGRVVANRGHDSYWTADAALNYVFSDCMSAGLTGSYILQSRVNNGPKGKTNVDGYTVGVNFKVAF